MGPGVILSRRPSPPDIPPAIPPGILPCRHPGPTARSAEIVARSSGDLEAAELRAEFGPRRAPFDSRPRRD
jgi:hypothetical protein